MNVTEHFDWAVTRALEYTDRGDGPKAMASIVSDLRKHPDTVGILTPDLQTLFLGEVMIGGASGARRFIEGIPRPRPEPTDVDKALEKGWNDVADRLERHAAAGYVGDWLDPQYDDPAPTGGEV